MSDNEELEDPQQQIRIDEAALDAYLKKELPDYAGGLIVRQFRGGQSNPTFMLESGDTRYVLRKKPGGTLLKSAHMVDREYRVMTALRDTDVPVPRTYCMCEDDSVLGTMFFVMEYLPGRLFWDQALPDLQPAQRAACYDEKNRVLAALHSVDPVAVGLGDYGKHGEYIARQVHRWSKQYIAAKTSDVPEMDRLMEWLPGHIPALDLTCLVHGDFRFDNMMFHPTEPRVLGILDWELSTLGHPFSDLAYDLLRYHLPAEDGKSLADRAGDSGIPTEAAYVADYCRRRGLDAIPDYGFYMAFSLFRLASIVQGVYRRGLDGNASSPEALAGGENCRLYAQRAVAMLEQDESYEF